MMNEKLSLEELKFKNEMLKNKTEKLKLTRNIVAIISIVISIVGVIFGFGKIGTKPVDNIPEIKVDTNSSTDSKNQTIKDSNTNIVDDETDNDNDDDDDE